jgi:multiple sugar transport system ATP-binding protein
MEENKAVDTTKDTSELKEKVVEAIKLVYDPEIPVDVYELGLIYEISIYPVNNVYIQMTLTSPACPSAEAIPEEIEERVRKSLVQVNLVGKEDRYPQQLSGGEQQRVAVARTLVTEPRILLFDEPLSNLDAKLRVQMRTEISKLHQKLKATIIYVTHDQTEAMTMGDRIVIMKDGDIHQIDTPLHLYNHPVNKFVAGFIGSPSMNFIDGKLISESGLFFVDNSNSIKLKILSKHEGELAKYLNKDLTIGIRPEDIHAQYENKNDLWDEISVKLDVIEPMGNEIFLYFNISSSNIIARIPTFKEEEPQTGEKLTLYVDTSRMHFFDKDSERSILE